METMFKQRPTSLNEVTIQRINEKIAKSQTSGVKALERMAREETLLKDFIVPLGTSHRAMKPVITFDNDGQLLMLVDKGKEKEQYRLHQNAVGQLSQRMNIPGRYLQDLAGGDEWQRNLASTILNEHTGWADREKVLVRAVEDDARAILSDKYKRINSSLIISAFINTAMSKKCNGVLVDGHMNDTKIWLETLSPVPVDIDTPKNGIVSLAFGARFSTSDYGDGAMDLRAFILNGVCLNGMVREQIIRQTHLGERMKDDLALSERTFNLQSRAWASAIEDYTNQIYDPNYIRSKMVEVMAASATEINAENEVVTLTKTAKLQKEEGHEILKIMIDNKPEDGVQGESTLWKLTQAITAFARKEDPRRQRELQQIAGDLMGKTNKA